MFRVDPAEPIEQRPGVAEVLASFGPSTEITQETPEPDQATGQVIEDLA